jgi:hypothetical protein
VSGREYRWTEEGRRSAIVHDVALAGVVQALYSNRQYSNAAESLLVLCGEADTGRIVTILLERFDLRLDVYSVIGARSANDAELAEWRKRFQ